MIDEVVDVISKVESGIIGNGGLKTSISEQHNKLLKLLYDNSQI